MAEVGERLASLEASFKSFEKYSHERWHDLSNDLTPVVNMPGQIARDIGKLEGRIDGKISSAVENITKSVRGDIEKLERRIDGHEDQITGIKLWQSRWTAGKVTTLVIGQALLNAIVAIATVMSVAGRHT